MRIELKLDNTFLYDDSNRQEVCPGVYVYHNLIPNVDQVFDQVVKSSNDKVGSELFPAWGDWTANWQGKACQINLFNNKVKQSDSEEIVTQKNIMSGLVDAYTYAYKNYIDSYKDKDNCPWDIEDWDYNNSSLWVHESLATMLKYTNPDLIEDKGIQYLGKAMHYHTDADHSDLESPKYKKIMTVTMYLNDDYEGGEVSFYDTKTNKLYNYKPKKGDVTVFPSYRPYYHGVLPFAGNDRYLIRMFFQYNYPGSSGWLSNEIKYGKEVWEQMEKEKIVSSYNNSENNLYLSTDINVREGQKTFLPAETIVVS